MKNAKELISSTYQNQAKWLGKNYSDHLLNAHNGGELGTLITGLEEQMANYIDFQYTDELGELIYGYSEETPLLRAKQINTGTPLTEGEKEVLRAHIIEEELINFGGTHMVNPCTYVEIAFGKTNLFSVYYGLIEGQGGYNPAFVGIFESLEAAKAELEGHGHFIDDHVPDYSPSATELSQALLEQWLTAKKICL
ncbi:MAG: hypothetical protein OSB27_05765 [Planktomarina sp.]|nr:hypothetical protein [Planktomarina sp.]